MEHFAVAVMELLPPGVLQVVDWCAGKGCLGRTVSYLSGLPALLLDRREALCGQALDAARRAGACCAFAPLDVYDDNTGLLLGEDTAVVGLHACGSLTDELIERCVSRRVPSLAVSSCCYNKLHEGEFYRPLSTQGAGSLLESIATACGWPARTNGRRVRLSAIRDAVRRLGVSAWTWASTKAPPPGRYRTQGELPRRYFDLPSGEFCRRVGRECSLELPACWSEHSAEKKGRERARQVGGSGSSARSSGVRWSCG